jgi:hypothetical protein
VRAADLWLEAARRALREGSLGSAEALALRAQGARPLETDRVLLSMWTIAGQPLRALEVGHRVLSAGNIDPAVRTEVLFELVDAMITAGCWDGAENYLGHIAFRNRAWPVGYCPSGSRGGRGRIGEE